MHEHTAFVASAKKSTAGAHYALTYNNFENAAPGIPSYQPTGAFTFVKHQSKWFVSHHDYTVEGNPQREYTATHKTLKAAEDFAFDVVRNLPANVGRRREAALKGAMPVGG